MIFFDKKLKVVEKKVVRFIENGKVGIFLKFELKIIFIDLEMKISVIVFCIDFFMWKILIGRFCCI